MSESNESKKELYQALSDFQDQCPEIELDGEVIGGKVKYKYAKLPSLLKTTQPVLRAVGLTSYHYSKDGILFCVVAHIDTGQIIESSLPLTETPTNQQTGQAFTYACRYTYCGLLGIRGEEDKDNPPKEKKSKAKPKLGPEAFEKLKLRIQNGEQGLYEKIKGMATLTEAQNETLLDLAIKHETN